MFKNTDANCWGMDPTMFVGPDLEASSEDREFREQEAKAVCVGCPLITECLQWALDHREWGVWGGTTRDERRAIREGRALRDPSGLKPQQIARQKRYARACELFDQGWTREAISIELGVKIGTIYDYLRKRKRHVETDQGSGHHQANAANGTNRHADPERETSPVLSGK